jgi:hypothetical protein
MAKKEVNIQELATLISNQLIEFQKGEKTAESITRFTKQIEQQTEALEEYKKELEKTNVGETERLSLTQQRLKLQRQLTQSQIELAKVDAETSGSLEALRAELKKINEDLEEATVKFDNFKGSFLAGQMAGEKLADSLGIVDNELDKFIGHLGDGKLSISSFTEGLKKNFSVSKIATSFLITLKDASFKLGEEVNKVNSQFRKDYSVEYGNRLAKTTMSVEGSLRRFNISYTETAAAVESLNLNVSDFTEMSDSQKESLTRDSALLAKAGVDNEQYAQTIQSMTKAFGDSVEGAQENVREMRAFSASIGKSTKEVMSDFSKVRSYLAQFGSNYEKIFRKMELISRKTGLAIEDLKGIAEGFDTFDGAAESVGKLNALLGGPFLNTVDLINTEDPAEQIMKIKESFDAAGRSVKSMTRRELQAFASAVPGINGDVEKLKTLFGQLDDGMIDSADSINAVLESSENSTKSLEDQAVASLTTREAFDAMGQLMAAPAEDLDRIANAMTDLIGKLNSFGETLKYVFGLIPKTFMKIGSAFSSAAPKVAAEGAEAAAKGGGLLGKGAATLSKKIPFLSLLTGGTLAVLRGLEGDSVGAGLELASGVAGMFPGVGTAVGTGIDAALLARDMGMVGGPKLADGGITTRPVTNATIGEAGREAIIPLESGANHLAEPLAMALKQVAASGGGTPNINLTVVLEGREMRAFVKQVVADSLNPFK